MKINVLSKSIIRVLSLVLILTLALFAVSCGDEPENPKGDRIISYVFFDYELEYSDNSCEPYIDYQTADSLGKEYIVLSLFEDNYFMLAIGGEVYSGSYDRSNEELHLDGISELDKNRLSFEEYSVKLDGSSLVFTARGRHLDKIIERATVRLTESHEIYNKNYFDSLSQSPESNIKSIKYHNLFDEYKPGEFTPDGIMLEIFYKDGSSKVVPLTDAHFKDYESHKPGAYNFYFEYEGYSSSFTYKIYGNSGDPTTTLPEFADKTVTYTGEAFTHMPPEVAGLRYESQNNTYVDAGQYYIQVEVFDEGTGMPVGSLSAMLTIEPKVIELDEVSNKEVQYSPKGFDVLEVFDSSIYSASVLDYTEGACRVALWLSSNYIFDDGSTYAEVNVSIIPMVIDASEWRWIGEEVITYSPDIWSRLPKIDPSSVDGEILHFIQYNYFGSGDVGADGKPNGEMVEGPMRIGKHTATVYTHDKNYVIEGLEGFEFELLPLVLPLPTVEREYAYTGDYTGPVIAGIDALNMGHAWYDGTAEARESGEYSFTIYLYDEGLICWEDGSFEPKSFTWQISYRKATLNVSMSAFDGGLEYTYDGFARGVSVTYEGTPYNVYLNNELIAQNVYQNGSFYALSMPGTYNLRIETVGENTENAVWEKTVVIKHIMVTLKAEDFVWSENSPTYDGEYHYKTIISYPEYVIPQYMIMSARDAGEHTLSAYFVIADEYYSTHRIANPEFVSETKLVIAKRAIDKPTVNKTEFTYTGSYIDVISGTSQYYTVAGDTARDAGNYTATVTPGKNYCWNDGTDTPYTINYTISPKTVNLGEMRFEGDSFEYSYGGVYLPFYKYSELDDYFTYEITGNFATEPGEYRAVFTATLKSGILSSNFIFTKANGEEITLGDDGKLTVTHSWSIGARAMDIPVANTVTYNGTQQKPTISGYDADIMSYDSEKSYKNAGTYYITLSIKNNNYYYFKGENGEKLSSVTVSFVIERAKAHINTTLPFTWQDYDGNEYYATATYGVGSEVLNAKVTYLFGDNSTPVSSIKNAGKYTVIFELSDTVNYYLDSPVSATVNVTKASVNISALVWSADSFTYTGAQQKPVITGGIRADMSQPSYTYTTDATNAGTHRVTVLFPENDNYLEATFTKTYKIERKLVDLPVFTKTVFTYTGEFFKPEYTTDGYTVTERSYEYSNVGNYSFTYDIDQNHIWKNSDGELVTYHTVSWSIEKANHDLSGVKWNMNASTVYPSDGTVYRPELTGLPSTVYAVYSGDRIVIERGEYYISVTLYSYDVQNYTAPVLDESLLSLSFTVGYVQSGDFTYYCTSSGAVLHSYSGSSESLTLPSIIDGKTVIGFDAELLHSHSEIKVLDMGTLSPSATSLKDLTKLEKLTVSNLPIPLTKAFAENALYGKPGFVPSSLDVLSITDAHSMTNTFGGFVGSEIHITASSTVRISVNDIKTTYLKYLTLIETSESATLTFVHRYASGSSGGGFDTAAIATAGKVTIDYGYYAPPTPTVIDTYVVIDGVHYSINGENKTAALLYVTPREELTLPATLTVNGESYTLTEIAECALAANYHSLKSLSLPFLARFKGTPTALSELFGYGTAPSLESLEILSGTTLAANSLLGFDNLKELTLPSDLTAIYAGILKDTKVSSLTLPKGVTDIPYDAFGNNSYLKELTVLAESFTVGDYAFSQCVNLKTINLAGATSIGNGAFSNCKSLTGISLDSAKTIGEYAFFETAISTVTVPDTVTSIGRYAFGNTHSLKSVYWNVKSFTGNSYSPLFSNANVTVFELGESVRTLDGELFNQPLSLKKLIIPENVSSFTKVFSQTVNVVELIFSATNYTSYSCATAFVTADVIRFTEGVTFVPEGFGAIGKNVILPESLEEIRDNARLGAYSIEFSTGLKTLGSYAITYEGKFLTLPDGLEALGEYSISATTLVQLTIPASVKEIAPYAIYVNGVLNELYNLSGIEERTLQASTIHTTNEPSVLRTDSQGFVYYKYSYLDYETIVAYVGADTEIRLPDGEYGVNGLIFKGTSVKSVTVPASTTIHLSSSVFAHADELESVTFGDGYTTLPTYLFTGSKNLTEVILPKTLTSIESSMFEGCTALEEISIPSSVKTIGAHAFRNCTALKSIALPGTLTEIKSYAFHGCTALEGVSFGSSLTTIGSHAFYKCTSLDAVSLPAAVQSIGNYAFYDCTALRSITLRNGLTEIGEYAFYNCGKLSSLTLPSTLKKIGSSAFARTAITTLHIPGATNYIGSYAFSYCESLKSISFDATTESVSYGAYIFMSCSALESVILPSNMTFIPDGMFSDTEMDSITIPGSVTRIGQSAFTVERVFYQGTLEDYLNIDFTSPIFSSYPLADNRLYINGLPITELTVPYGVEEIKPYAFANLNSLQSVALADSVTTVGDSAFMGCTSLSKIVLSKSLVGIGKRAFASVGLTGALVIPDGVTAIGAEAFHGTKASVVVIPGSVTEIGTNVFGYTSDLVTLHTVYNYSLVDISSMLHSTTKIVKNIDSDNLEAFSIGDFIFEKVGGVYYLIKYNGTALHLTLPESVNGESYVIASYAFANNKTIATLKITDGVRAIESNAFYGIMSLYQLTLGKNVESIGDYAFQGCSRLTEIYNLSSLTLKTSSTANGYIAYYAYTVHESLNEESIFTLTDDGFVFFEKNGTPYLIAYVGESTEITMPSSYNGKDYYLSFMGRWDITKLTITGGILNLSQTSFTLCDSLITVNFSGIEILNGFAGLKSLKTVNIGSGVKEIGMYAFTESDIESIYIPANVTKIDSYAFARARRLTTVSGMAGVVTIESSAFADCHSLTSITLATGLTQIKTQAFAKCYALKNVNLPQTLITIEENAFEHCDNLKTNYYLGGYYLPSGTNSHFALIKFDTQADGVYKVHAGAQVIADNAIPSSAEYVLCYGSGIKSNLPGVTTLIGSADTVYEKNGFILGLKADGTLAVLGYTADELNLTIPSEIDGRAVSEISSYAFLRSTLRTVKISLGIVKIGEGAFKDCRALMSVSFPTTLLRIERKAFSNCENLKEVKISANLELIGEYAFENAYRISEVFINGSVELIGECAFAYNTKLTKVTVSGYVGKIDESVFSWCNRLHTLKLSGGVGSIEKYAFYECTSLENLYLRGEIDKIDLEYVFTTFNLHYFGSLTEWAGIEFIGSLTNIKNLYFDGKNTESIVIPDGITSIAEGNYYHFENLKSITIPASVSYIGENAFRDYRIEEIYFDGTLEEWMRISWKDVLFTAEENGAKLYIGGELVEHIRVPAGITEIRKNCFGGISSIKSVTLHSGVTKINDYAFYGCTSLKEITGLESVTEIGAFAFSHTAITELTLYESTVKIGNSAFSLCKELLSVTVLADLYEIPEHCFNQCKKLTEVNIAGEIKKIGNYAFSVCNALVKVVIPDSVTEIGGLTFNSCTSLQSITFGSGITQLNLNTIHGCPSLTEIIFTDPEGWCDSDGNPLDLSDASENANILNALYAARKGTITKN